MKKSLEEYSCYSNLIWNITFLISDYAAKCVDEPSTYSTLLPPCKGMYRLDSIFATHVTNNNENKNASKLQLYAFFYLQKVTFQCKTENHILNQEFSAYIDILEDELLSHKRLNEIIYNR